MTDSAYTIQDFSAALCRIKSWEMGKGPMRIAERCTITSYLLGMEITGIHCLSDIADRFDRSRQTISMLALQFSDSFGIYLPSQQTDSCRQRCYRAHLLRGSDTSTPLFSIRALNRLTRDLNRARRLNRPFHESDRVILKGLYECLRRVVE